MILDATKPTDAELGRKSTELLRNLNSEQQKLFVESMTNRGLRLTLFQLLKDFDVVSEAFNDLCNDIEDRGLWNEVNSHDEARDLTKEV